MTDPGSLLKFRRAEQHLAEAQTHVRKFLARNPYEIAREEEGEPNRTSFWVTLHEEVPADVSLAAGDAIHNLRSALDHIVYEISSKREANPRNTSFPCLAKESDWDQRREDGSLQPYCGLNRIRLLPDEAQTIVYNLQPWPREQPFMPDLFGPNRERLRELHLLDIADKHKNLNVAVLEIDVVGVGHNETDPDFEFEYVLRKGPLQPDTRTLVLRLFNPSKVQVEFLPTLDIVFSEGSAWNEPVVGKLLEIYRNVGMVLNALSRFA